MRIQEGDIIFHDRNRQGNLGALRGLLLSLAPGLFGVLLSVLLAGCAGPLEEGDGGKTGPGAEVQSGPEAEENGPQEETGLYILLNRNEEKECIFIQSVDTGRQGEFKWNDDTVVYDREREKIDFEELTTGELLELQFTEDEELTEIAVSDRAFVLKEVTEFSIDDEAGIFAADGREYHFDESLKIFSEDGLIPVNELSRIDTLCVWGFEENVYTLTVTRGHGIVTFRNTRDFEGGTVTIGDMDGVKITRDLTLELPEGTYTVRVDKDGHGGSIEITVNRFEELAVDLNAIEDEN